MMCSNYDNHSRFNSQQKLGEPIWPFNKHKNVHFDNIQDGHVNSKYYEESSYDLHLDLANHLVLMVCFIS